MSSKELYLSIDKHLTTDEKPSVFLNGIYDEPEFGQYPFAMLRKLRTTEQSPEHHPEGNVWNHTMLVVDEAAKVRGKSKNPRVFMWAALLHDIGKPSTFRMKKGRITAYGHDKAGETLAEEFLAHFAEDDSYIREVTKLVRYHMHMLYVVKDLPFADVQGMKKNTDIKELALLGLCDRMGRTNADRQQEEAIIRQFLLKCS
jgi:putative nucleotidyltransferase with HDIG domain